ncbi:hypothetical protein CCH79_00009776 [Gambusia affinis]|uniref:LARP4/4B RNA recognition motif domain-containing protein n=1 Tax=Gambusia affinis TaxID=33528 RepID=A0A315W280_GAMAF|nr:hypothetical protein CCH79_00009776 [Gambusia affinis]
MEVSNVTTVFYSHRKMSTMSSTSVLSFLTWSRLATVTIGTYWSLSIWEMRYMSLARFSLTEGEETDRRGPRRFNLHGKNTAVSECSRVVVLATRIHRVSQEGMKPTGPRCGPQKLLFSRLPRVWVPWVGGLGALQCDGGNRGRFRQHYWFWWRLIWGSSGGVSSPAGVQAKHVVGPCFRIGVEARIKAKAIAINTFMPKNGYRPVEVNPYAQQQQQQQQQQQRYTSYYIPPVYSPQQQFPLYSLITPQAWSTTHSFIDPALVTPFHNNQFINGFTTSHSFKPATSPLTVRHFSPRNRNHSKPHLRPNIPAADRSSGLLDSPSLFPGFASERLNGVRSSPPARLPSGQPRTRLPSTAAFPRRDAAGTGRVTEPLIADYSLGVGRGRKKRDEKFSNGSDVTVSGSEFLSVCVQRATPQSPPPPPKPPSPSFELGLRLASSVVLGPTKERTVNPDPSSSTVPPAGPKEPLRTSASPLPPSFQPSPSTPTAPPTSTSTPSTPLSPAPSASLEVKAAEAKPKEAPPSVERVPGTLSTASKSVQVNGAATELRKPSYAEICQRAKDAPTPPHSGPPKEAKPSCAAPAGEERKCSDASSTPSGEHKPRETYHPPSKAGPASTSRPLKEGRRPAGRWASPPPHPGKPSSRDAHHTPPKSPQ